MRTARSLRTEEGLCQGGSLSSGVSVWGVSVQGGGLCPGEVSA